jgi:hypothetical protein
VETALIPRRPSDRPAPSGGPRPVPVSDPLRAAAAGPAPEPSAEQELDRLADSIEKFKVESDKFLNGAQMLLPDELRAKILRELRDLRSRNLKSAAEQFRLGTLEARYNSLAERFGRRLREREEGLRGPQRPAAPARRLDPQRGIVLDEALDRDAVAALAAALARGGAPAPDLDTFRDYLGRQLAQVRAKTGARQVQFRLAVEEGKAKLKAKPLLPAPGRGPQKEPT